MSLSLLAFTYVVIWALLFQALLPVGVKPPEKVESGHIASAPDNPMLGIKIAATSVLSALITWGVYALLQSGVIDIRHAVQ